MKTRAVLSLLLVFLLLCALPGAAAKATPAEDLRDALDSYIEEHAATTAGLAVCVFDGESTTYENFVGYADTENRLPVTEETVFEWGSVSKLTVWVSVMQLREQGLLDLNADIRDYLPEGFLRNLRFETPVTLLDLMNHRAGFQELVTEIFLPEGEPIPSLEEALQKHMPAQVYAPDTVTAYSNWGNALAAYIVQRVSGEDYCDYVHAHIFAPLGMAHTALAPDLHDNPWVREQREKLQCYTTDAKLIPGCFYAIPLYPCGMVTGTLADLTAFARALLTDDSPLFARPETVRELFSPSSVYPGTDIPWCCHGFWMEFFGVPVCGHGGNTAGCSSYLLLDRENGRGMTVMTNQYGESVYNIDMPALVFGTYEPDMERTLPKGIYRSARTVFRGPLKIYSVMMITLFTKDDLENFWLFDGESVYFPYGSMTRIPTATAVWELLLLLGFALSVLYSAGLLLSWPIGALRRKKRGLAPREDARRVLRRWIAALPLLTAGLIAFAVVQLFRYAPTRCYRWCFVAAFLLVLALPVLAILYLRKPRAEGKGARALDIFALLALAALEANLLYWQLFAFWAL